MGKVDVVAGRHRGTNRSLYIRPNPEIRESLMGPRTNKATGHRFWDLEYLVAERRVLRVWEKTR